MAEEAVAWRQGWLERHPGWSHRVWREADLDFLVNRREFEQAQTRTHGPGRIRTSV
jgi:hypothetical protein